MITTYKMDMDLWAGASSLLIDVAQDDCGTRAVELTLREGDSAWDIPEGVTAMIRYCKADGTGGTYDTLPDGARAWHADENRLTVLLAPQMLTSDGPVKMDVLLVSGEKTLSTFSFFLNVQQAVICEGEASRYYRKISGFLPLPDTAEVGDVVTVKAVDSFGKPTAVEAKPYCIVQESGASATAVMSQKAVTDAMAQAVQTGPEFVNDVSECTDTGRLYVLPDGYIYVYMRSTTEQDPNMFDPAAASLNVRLNSSGTEVALNGSYCTDFIPVDLSALDPYIVRLPTDFHASYGNQRAILYDAGKNILQNCYINNKNDGDIVSCVYTAADGRCYIRLGYYGDSADPTAPDAKLVANAKFVRFSILKNESATALSASDISNAVIQFDALYVSENTYAWCSTGRAYQAADYEDRILAAENGVSQNAASLAEVAGRVTALEDGVLGKLPSYWKDYLPEQIQTVRQLQEQGGKDCFSFPVLTDIHISANLGKYSGLLTKAIMDQCDMRFALCLGDVMTRGTEQTEEAVDASFSAAEALLAPIRDRLLQTQGNHDGAWGAEDLDSDGDVEGSEFYCYNVPPRKLHRLIYRKVGLVGDVHFDETGTGYYVDDRSSKVRYILLNSHCHPYEQNSDGTAKYNTMRLFRFRQAQYNLLVEALTTVPGDDWAVVSASHVPLNDDYAELFGGTEGDHVLMRRLLAAYQQKKPFTGQFAGTCGEDAVGIAVDFSNAKGQYIAHFSGHCHMDTCGVYDGITVVTTRCDGHEENDQTSTLYTERIAGTVTEQSFDIITVDRSARTIHATKIGAGECRRIPY